MKEDEDYFCNGCGERLIDCGHIGYACLNKNCDYEVKQAIRWLRQIREQEERSELARLKRKYEDNEHES